MKKTFVSSLILASLLTPTIGTFAHAQTIDTNVPCAESIPCLQAELAILVQLVSLYQQLATVQVQQGDQLNQIQQSLNQVVSNTTPTVVQDNNNASAGASVSTPEATPEKKEVRIANTVGSLSLNVQPQNGDLTKSGINAHFTFQKDGQNVEGEVSITTSWNTKLNREDNGSIHFDFAMPSSGSYSYSLDSLTITDTSGNVLSTDFSLPVTGSFTK